MMNQHVHKLQKSNNNGKFYQTKMSLSENLTKQIAFFVQMFDSFLGLQLQLSYGQWSHHSPLLLRVAARGGRSSPVLRLATDGRQSPLSRSSSSGSDFVTRTDSGAKYLNIKKLSRDSPGSSPTIIANEDQIVHPLLCSKKQLLHHPHHHHLHHQYHLTQHPPAHPSSPHRQPNNGYLLQSTATPTAPQVYVVGTRRCHRRWHSPLMYALSVADKCLFCRYFACDCPLLTPF